MDTPRHIEQAGLADYATITADLGRYWGSAAAAPMHHPLLIREFGDLALVIRTEDDGVAAYLMGFISTTEPVGYVHLVGVRDDHRRRGLGADLWAEFRRRAKARGATSVKAIARPDNAGSLAFHTSIGMDVELVRRYFPEGFPLGTDRNVFTARLD